MAYEEKINYPEAPHNLALEGRKKLTLSGIRDVDSFNEEEVVMTASKWSLTVRGAELKMEKMSVDSGDVVITGRIDAVEYEDAAPVKAGFLSKLFG